ncbi:hypothetical protein [Streptomyces vastus]|uniref:Integral membrane protein n=1 Tax=Streptomyces vastus TaxID=285451 RepID=A0ABP6E4E2_9ACTN
MAGVFRCYRRLFRPALLTWSPFVLLAAVALTDLAVLRTTALGPVLAPLLAVVVVIATSSGIVAMAALPDDRRATVLRRLLAASYASVRRWPYAPVNLGLLGTTLLIVNQAPLLGLAVVPGCVLRNRLRLATSASDRRPGSGRHHRGGERKGMPALSWRRRYPCR